MRLPLDQNFPAPILGQLKPWMGDIQLLPLRTIDEELTQLDDRDLLIALKQLEFEGLVTLNYKMLRNPKELAAVLKTKLNIFAVEGVGQRSDPRDWTVAPGSAACGERHRVGEDWSVLATTSFTSASRSVGAV